MRAPRVLPLLHVDGAGRLTRVPTRLDCERGRLAATLASTSAYAGARLQSGAALPFTLRLPLA